MFPWRPNQTIGEIAPDFADARLMTTCEPDQERRDFTANPTSLWEGARAADMFVPSPVRGRLFKGLQPHNHVHIVVSFVASDLAFPRGARWTYLDIASENLTTAKVGTVAGRSVLG